MILVISPSTMLRHVVAPTEFSRSPAPSTCGNIHITYFGSDASHPILPSTLHRNRRFCEVVSAASNNIFYNTCIFIYKVFYKNATIKNG